MPGNAKKNPGSRSTAKAGFSDEERAAMKERVGEGKRAAGRGKRAASPDGEQELLAKVAAMLPSDRAIAEQLHALVKANAPELEAGTWYGMPAYARAGKNVFFFQPSAKFKTRYSTLGFNDSATLDDGSIWPVSYAISEWTPAVEQQVTKLLRQALG